MQLYDTILSLDKHHADKVKQYCREKEVFPSSSNYSGMSKVEDILLPPKNIAGNRELSGSVIVWGTVG